MNFYLAQNGKMKKATKRTFNFGIPALRSASGFVTCPSAGVCAKPCYARKAAYTWKVVKNAYEERLALSLTSDFVPVISHEIKRRRIDRVRIHDSGDFYSSEYLDKWIEIMRRHPNVEFYTYTKRVLMLKDYDRRGLLPGNFSVVLSVGGKEDHYIDTEKDRHAWIFTSKENLLKAGYADASQDDTVATGENRKIGLIWH